MGHGEVPTVELSTVQINWTIAIINGNSSFIFISSGLYIGEYYINGRRRNSFLISYKPNLGQTMGRLCKSDANHPSCPDRELRRLWRNECNMRKLILCQVCYKRLWKKQKVHVCTKCTVELFVEWVMPPFKRVKDEITYAYKKQPEKV